MTTTASRYVDISTAFTDCCKFNCLNLLSDINECVTENGGCDQHCHNTICHITVPVTVAGDWILMNILAMVKQLFRFLVLRNALSQSSQTPMSARRTSQAAHRYVQTTLAAMFVLHRIQFRC